jgi:hypothetical protein
MTMLDATLLVGSAAIGLGLFARGEDRHAWREPPGAISWIGAIQRRGVSRGLK